MGGRIVFWRSGGNQGGLGFFTTIIFRSFGYV
uniref:Uncharacterized protein n=1 Tax=Ackermannviridae sp. TaxID=2831612 RepID=A0A8S5RR13_9CAUD|nr:MAG TPA: hypothetical protein [Ackermannviridae sp.]